MDLHFRAFSFVDRITDLRAGSRITGQYVVPAKLAAFPNSLAAEAVGQLAAWAAMASLDFSRRPVAGLAGRIELLGPVHPGQTLSLAADLESVDEEAIAYSGIASADGHPVVRLSDCVGPMLPLSEFDDPQQVRDRFELLQGNGAVAGAFGGVPELTLDALSLNSPSSLRATMLVPRKVDFFADHFPRRPVFPGTLLTHNALRLAIAFMDSVSPSPAGSAWVPHAISDVKLRSFASPGQIIELEARQGEPAEGGATVALRMDCRGLRIGRCCIHLALGPGA